MKNIFKSVVMLLGALTIAQGSIAAGDAKAGEEKVAACAACHGADGNSAAPNFPKLAGLGEKYLLKQLKDIKAGTRVVPEMTGLLNNSSDQDLADMAAYFNSKPLQLSGAKEIRLKVNAGIEVDGLALGEKIFRSGNAEVGLPACTGCHSPRGLGNGPAGYPRLSGQHAEYIEKQLHNFRAGERVNDGDVKTMRQVAQYMTDAQIKAVANYIAGLN